jgi:hypothetical protein
MFSFFPLLVVDGSPWLVISTINPITISLSKDELSGGYTLTNSHMEITSIYSFTISLTQFVDPHGVLAPYELITTHKLCK